MYANRKVRIKLGSNNMITKEQAIELIRKYDVCIDIVFLQEASSYEVAEQYIKKMCGFIPMNDGFLC